MIQISVKDAKAISQMFENIKIADSIYHGCQSNQFRLFVQQSYKAAKTEKAYENLSKLLYADSGEDIYPNE